MGRIIPRRNPLSASKATIAGVGQINLDTTPDAFAFIDQTEVPLSSVRTSNIVQITGINGATLISVVNGLYSVNGGPFTSLAGFVVNNDQVQVRHTSSGANGTAVVTQLIAGSTFAYFTSTTVATVGASPNPLYPLIDMSTIPFHVAAGAYGPQVAFQTASLPSINRSVNASTLAEVQSACNTPGARITLTANIVGGNISGANLSDCEIVVPNGILANFILGQYGVTNWTRLRLTKASGDVIGGQWHNLFVTGATLNDFICDGLQVSGSEAYGPSIYNALTVSSNRLAILRNRIKGVTATYGYGADNILFAGNSIRHNASDVEGTGDWGSRISAKGPSIFMDNDIRAVVTGYAPARWHPASGVNPHYIYIARNTTVSRNQSRGFWINDVEGSVGYPGVNAAWLLQNRHYVNGNFVMLMNRAGGGPTCAYVRANDNFVYGFGSGINTGGAPDSETLRNTYDVNPGVDPPWGPAGDPSGINLNP